MDISDDAEEAKHLVSIRVAGLLDLGAAALLSGAALPGAPKMNLVKSIIEHDNYNNIPSRNGDGKSSERDSDNGLSEHCRVDKGGTE